MEEWFLPASTASIYFSNNWYLHTGAGYSGLEVTVSFKYKIRTTHCRPALPARIRIFLTTADQIVAGAYLAQINTLNSITSSWSGL